MASNGELTKEQLIDYVKKQKLKIKKLENEIIALKQSQPNDNSKTNESQIENSSSKSAQEIAILEKKIVENDQKWVKLLDEKKEEYNLLKRKFDELTIVCESTQKELNEINDVNVKLQYELMDIRKENSTSKTTSFEISSKYEDLLLKFDKKNAEYKMSSANYNQQIDELNQLLKESGSNKNSSDELSKEINEIKSHLQQTKAMNDRLEEEKQSLMFEKAELQTKLDNFDVVLGKENIKYFEMKSKYEETQHLLNKLEQRNDSIVSESQSLRNELNGLHDDHCSELSKLKAKYDEEKATMEATSRQLIHELEEKWRQLKDAEESIHLFKIDKEDREKDATTIQAEYNAMERRLSEVTKELEALHSKYLDSLSALHEWTARSDASEENKKLQLAGSDTCSSSSSSRGSSGGSGDSTSSPVETASITNKNPEGTGNPSKKNKNKKKNKPSTSANPAMVPDAIEGQDATMVTSESVQPSTDSTKSASSMPASILVDLQRIRFQNMLSSLRDVLNRSSVELEDAVKERFYEIVREFQSHLAEILRPSVHDNASDEIVEEKQSEVTKDRSSLQQECQRAEQQCEQYVKTIKELECTGESYRRKGEEAAKSHHAIAVDVALEADSLNLALKEHLETIQSLESRLAESDEKQSASMEMIEGLQESLKMLQARYNEQGETERALTSKYEKAEKMAQVRLQDILHQGLDEERTLRTAAEEATGRLRLELNQVRHDYDEYRVIQERLKDEMVQKKGDLESVMDELQESRSNCIALESKMKDIEQQSAVSVLELADRLKEKERLFAEQGSALTGMVDSHSKVSEKLESLSKEKALLEDEMEVVRSRWSDSNHYKTEWQQVKEERDLLEEKLRSLEAKYEEVKESEASQSKSDANAMTQLEATNKKLMTKMKAKLKESQEMTVKIAELTKQLTRCDEVESELKGLVEELREENARWMKKMTSMEEEGSEGMREWQVKCQMANQKMAELEEKVLVGLRRENEEMSQRLREEKRVRMELEQRNKGLNDAMIHNEERIGVLLKEKNQIQEELFGLNRKLEVSKKDLEDWSMERERMRQEIETLKQLKGEAEVAGQRQVASLTAKCNNQSQELMECRKKIETMEEELTGHHETKDAVTKANKKIKTLTEMIEVLKSQQEQQRVELEAKVESHKEKVAKLKSLLSKLNTVSQEKDAKLNQLMVLNERAKVFSIVLRLKVLTVSMEDWMQWNQNHSKLFDLKGITERILYGEESMRSSYSIWCLIAYGMTEGSKNRWVEESQLRRWIDSEGSSLNGKWPPMVQEVWTERITALKDEYDSKRQEWEAKYEEVSSQFQTYKIRAQTALKRIGNEDRNERHRQFEIEANEAEKLKETIKTLEEKSSEYETKWNGSEQRVGQLMVECAEKQSEAEELRKQLSESNERMVQLERKIVDQRNDLERLTMEKETMSQDLYKATKQLEKKLVEESIQAAKMKEGDPVAVVATAVLTDIAEVSSGMSIRHRMMSEKKLNELVRDHLANPADGGGDDEEDGGQMKRIRSPGVFIDSFGSNGGPLQKQNSDPMAMMMWDGSEKGGGSSTQRMTGNNLMLHQQTGTNLRDHLIELRQENSLLSVEINDIRKEIGFRDDQILNLKNTIRELESSMLREKEFNAANRRINADYLVNVLRKFLLTTNPEERAKLVPVLCTILHLQPDESKVIVDKWAVKTNTGLVGWLLPQRLPPVTSMMMDDGTDDGSYINGSSSSKDVLVSTEGMKMAREGMDNNMKRSYLKKTNDVTYDPVTGSGLGGGLDIYA